MLSRSKTFSSILAAVLCMLLFPGAAPTVSAQIVPVPNQHSFVDSLRREMDQKPYFGIYKDNYFTVGGPIGQKPNRKNCDVKFQISIAQRLTKSTLPFNTYLFLMYTQRVMWNVFEKSMPMRDLNFNPGIGLSKMLFSKDRYVGKLTLMLEHESNGRDSTASRSWNRITFGTSVMIDDWLTVHGKAWIPIVDGEHNRDILKYCGIWQSGIQVTTPNKRFWCDVVMVKRQGWNLNFNTILQVAWRIHPKHNQFLFAQYYNGYGENLLDYNKFRSRLRVGIVIKPTLFSEF